MFSINHILPEEALLGRNGKKKMSKPCFMFGSGFAKTAFFFQKAGEASVLELEK